LATNGRRKIRGPYLDRLRELHRKGYTAGQIYAELQIEFPGETTLRTVQREVKRLTPRDVTPAWNITDGTVDDAANVAETLADVLLFSEGRIPQLTQREADLAARIRRIAPDLSGVATFAMAREYMLRQDAGKDTADLDSQLVLSRDPESARRVHEANWPDRGFLLDEVIAYALEGDNVRLIPSPPPQKEESHEGTRSEEGQPVLRRHRRAPRRKR
jgi:hypothetical protein